MNTVFDLILAIPLVRHLADCAVDRHLFLMPPSIIQERPIFQQLRGKPIDKIDVLSSSIQRTGGSIHPLLVYAEKNAVGGVDIVVVDGAQRLRAERQAGKPEVFVQYISRWKTEQQAFQDAVDLNFARFEVGDEDLISILASGQITPSEAATHTGRSDTTVREFAKIAKHQWSWEPIRTKAVARARMSKLIDKCDQNPGKLEALRNTMTQKFKDATEKATAIREQIHAKRHTHKGNAKLEERSHRSFYFKNEDWRAWEHAIGNGEFETRQGLRFLKLEPSIGKATSPFVGQTEDWDREFAVYEFFGKKHEDITLDDCESIREQWDMIGERLDTIIARKRSVAAVSAHPMPTENPIVEIPTSPPPAEQQAAVKVGRRPKNK